MKVRRVRTSVTEGLEAKDEAKYGVMKRARAAPATSHSSRYLRVFGIHQHRIREGQVTTNFEPTPPDGPRAMPQDSRGSRSLLVAPPARPRRQRRCAPPNQRPFCWQGNTPLRRPPPPRLPAPSSPGVLRATSWTSCGMHGGLDVPWAVVNVAAPRNAGR